MVNLWGPGAHGAARPAAVRPNFTPDNAPGDVDDFYQDCSSPTLRDGTEWKAASANALLVNMRGVVRGTGTPDDNLDDMLLARAIQSGGMNWAAATGTENAWVVAPALALDAYKAGRVLWIKAPATNTSTTVTANISGLGTRPVKKSNGADPAIGDLTLDCWYPTIDDGSNIVVVSPLRSDIISASLKRNRVKFTAIGAGTWVVLLGVTRIVTKAWGPGGGGGYSTIGAASGGASGAYVERAWDVVPGSTVSFSNGAGGQGGAASPAQAGQPGGDTTITVGGTTITAGGGQGGLNGSTSNTSANSPAGGVPTGGDINLAGSPGPFGYVTFGPTILGGNGAGAPLGGPSVPGGAGAASDGQAPGGGGSASGSSSFPGGTGARGEIWIEY